MAYSNPSGRRPFELASKSAHHHIIKDPNVDALLRSCWVPPETEAVDLNDSQLVAPVGNLDSTGVRSIICIDGGYTESVIRARYPSVKVCFFQFGALTFTVSDLNKLDQTAFLRPEDMQRLKNLERIKLALPLSTLRRQDCSSFCESVRRTVQDFFVQTNIDDASLADTLAWFLFERYRGQQSKNEWILTSHPTKPDGGPLNLKISEMDAHFTFPDPRSQKRILLIDTLRLHERIDEEQGAASILGFLTNVIEQLMIVHIIRMLARRNRTILSHILFIKDGPLGFFGTTSRFYIPMRALIEFFSRDTRLNIVGIEKSGAFVDHALLIQPRLKLAQALLLNNAYIYRYILPTTADADRPYGDTSLYGHKLIYKTSIGQMHVLSLPSLQQKASPTHGDYLGLDAALAAVEALHCHKYDNALVPIALANQLVSLAAHPSQRILQQFAAQTVAGASPGMTG
jgi:hypothetical protein